MLTLSIEFAFAAILVAQYAVVPLYAQLHDRQFNAANANQSASSLVEESIRALGGRQALEALQSVTYESDR
jgi:hypothetical protein